MVGEGVEQGGEPQRLHLEHQRVGVDVARPARLYHLVGDDTNSAAGTLAVHSEGREHDAVPHGLSQEHGHDADGDGSGGVEHGLQVADAMPAHLAVAGHEDVPRQVDAHLLETGHADGGEVVGDTGRGELVPHVRTGARRPVGDSDGEMVGTVVHRRALGQKVKRSMPPATQITWPVTYLASGEQRKTMVLATSSGSPGARIAVRRIMRSFILGLPALNASVAMIPGATTLAVIPNRA